MTVVAVDVGGTKTAAAVVDADGATGAVVRAATPAAAGPAAVLDTVARVVREAAGGRPVGAVGIGTAGAVDPARGRFVSATRTFRDWVGTDVARGVGDRLRDGGAAPVVTVENDVDAHARGEHRHGAARGAASAVLVAVGTGVGGSLLVDGEPRRGARHVAGELGHVPVPGAEGLVCACGRTGHLEAVAAGPAIHRRYRDLGGEAGCTDAHGVVDRAARGDLIARGVVDGAAAALGRAVAGIVTVWDPHVVVVGGGVAGAGPRWWEVLRSTARAELVEVLADVEIRPAALGARAALVGAAHTARQALATKEDG